MILAADNIFAIFYCENCSSFSKSVMFSSDYLNLYEYIFLFSLFPSNVLLPSRYFSSFGVYSTADHFSLLHITVTFASKLSYGTADCSFFRVLRHLPASNFYILVTDFSFVLLMKIDAVSA